MSLKAKILMLVTVLISAIIAAVVVVAVRFVTADKLQELSIRAQRTADLQAAALSQPIWDMEDDQQTALLEALLGDSELVYAAILSSAGEPVLTVGKKPTEDGEVLTAQQKIFYDGDGENVEVGALQISFSKAVLEEQSATLSRYGLVAAIIILTVILGCVLFALGLFTKPLASITKTMNKLVEGDLSVNIPSTERKDEIGHMARSVKVFKDNAIENTRLQKIAEEAAVREREEQEQTELRKQENIEREKAEQKATEARRAELEARSRQERHDLASAFEQSIQGIIEQVAETSSHLKLDADNLSKISGEGVDQVTEGDRSVSEASSNTATIASSTEEMASSITEITRQITLSSTGANEAVERGERAQGQVQDLSDKAVAIDSVLTLIRDISEQTNLLALNATIEAARAGDAGKGFSVVASEVKSLATETAKAAAEIQGQVEDIQAATQETVGHIGSVVANVNGVGEMVAGIAAAVEEQDAATNEIARSARLASDSASSASKSISSLTSTVEETGGLSKSLNNVASNLAGQTDLLQTATADFLAGIREDSEPTFS